MSTHDTTSIRLLSTPDSTDRIQDMTETTAMTTISRCRKLPTIGSPATITRSTCLKIRAPEYIDKFFFFNFMGLYEKKPIHCFKAQSLLTLFTSIFKGYGVLEEERGDKKV